jgi:hypothetical protein
MLKHITQRAYCCAAIAAAVVFAALPGCRQSDRPTLGMVAGTVTLDGRPLAGANLVFEPVEGGRASTGYTDANGRYELFYIRRDKGAKVGRHKVVINAGDPDSGKAEIVPPRYNQNTTLEAEVKAGDNTLDFALTTAA